ncbi:AI-2E family transporter [Sphingomonadaceae bacterium OTU29MARTA1]|uniref:AI-2E family transporter n=1 Tax=Sphingomonas sp. Leaf37 TaxID=2876552 RepID=UPI001E40E49B|nr:AI-2E family transporter [Sphingomonas sp. Leaf37]USU07727.1 AI-2E family transporter [Sphingomonadaceae bacterium OTU29MARTA1]USU11218.1 AI-2E family transporter [Sphingomonadaceae bacterium OTU29THOMA1]
MTDAPLAKEPSPNELRDPFVRQELKRATVWLGLAGAIALAVILVQPLLIIFAGLVFAALLDGGVRLLGKVLPIGRGWRLLIVMLLTIAFLFGTFYLTGVQVSAQFSQLRTTLESQANRVAGWLSSQGLMPGASDVSGIARQALSSVGRITSWVGTAFGALTTMFMIIVIGLFVAMDPRTYQRGLEWMVPRSNRAEFAVVLERMGKTLRRLLAGRLLGMLAEGVLTWIALSIGGVPMAMILGILTGLLAFIPNIGAFISGALMVAVGFSAGTDVGYWAIGTYIVVQGFDGYVLLPIVAKKTVDLPPALTLGAQIMASALFGILGLALADPMTAMVKTALERSSEREGERDGSDDGVEQA